MTRAGRSNVGESGQRRRRARSPTLTPIRAHQIRDVPTTHRPTSHAATSGATSYQTTTAVDTFGVSWRTRPAPGSASGHTPGPVHAATALTPPAPRNARRIRSRLAPLVGASSRAPGRAHQPSRRDNLRRERPHQRRGGCGTPGGTLGATPPPSPCRASGKKWGVAPVLSLSAGAVRERRARTTNTNNDGDTMDGCVVHQTLCFWYTPPSVRVPLCVTPAVTPIVTPERSSRRGNMARVTMPPRDRSTGSCSISSTGQSRRAAALWWACRREVVARV